MKSAIILINQSKIAMPKKFIQVWLQHIFKSLKIKPDELTIVFLDPAQAKKINHQYRQKNYATDILSFQSEGGFGELVICPQVLKKQAAEHGLSFKQELGYMLIHGVLHLLGYEHEGKSRQNLAQAKKMYHLQDHLFDSLCTKFDL